ncbi:hypothetical protein ACVBEH_12355 [Roseateles sp. GG27B]
MRCMNKLVIALLLSSLTVGLTARPLFGFTAFPYDATAQAVITVQSLLREHANLYALHFDNGIPWDELLDGKPLPPKIQRDWDEALRAIPAGRPVYLGLAPLAKDRKSLAPGRGDKELPLPWSLKLAALDDDKVKAAYLQYARRAVRQFKPAYLNLGIEAGELAARDPKRWPQFEALYRHVAGALKREYPNMLIGISFGLQSLRQPEVAQRAKALMEASDYLGLSFYPHASLFGERFGEPALRAGEDAWREPLTWLRNYTSKPIAFCETGYLSRTATLPRLKLTLNGDAVLQASYVRELAQYAERDNYLFVVWFLAVDYDRLYERMGGDKPDNEVNLLWRNIGLWDGELRPKPALAEWDRAVSGRGPVAALRAAAPGPAASVTAPVAVAPSTLSVVQSVEIGFSSAGQLFQAGGGSQMVLEGIDGAQWHYKYRRHEWAWAVRPIEVPLPATARRMVLSLKSDRSGPLFLQVEQQGGETFFTMLEPKADWTEVTIELSSLRPDPAKRKDGVLKPDRIVKLLLADAAGRDGVEGQRSVGLARWRFE